MYDSYPELDVPQKNLIQRFFGQRWSAIVIEICMTIVISVAASRAFDLFGPFDSNENVSVASNAPALVATDAAQRGTNIPSEWLERFAGSYILNGQFLEAAAMYDLLIVAEPTVARHHYRRGLVNFFREAYAEGYADFVAALRMAEDCRSRDCHWEHRTGARNLRYALQFAPVDHDPLDYVDLASDLIPLFADVYLEIAGIYDKLGDQSKERFFSVKYLDLLAKRAADVSQ